MKMNSAPLLTLLCLLFCTTTFAAVSFTITPTTVYNSTVVTIVSSEPYFGTGPVVNSTDPFDTFVCNFATANVTATYVNDTIIRCRVLVLPFGYSSVNIVKATSNDTTVVDTQTVNGTVEYMPPTGVPCAMGTTPCTLPSYYNTTTHACPVPSRPAPATTMCRPSAGICDVIEYCTGASTVCPTDARSVNTTICRAAEDDCDMIEYCDGTSVTCPPDVLYSSHKICREAVPGQNPTGYCDGYNKICPFSELVPSYDGEQKMATLQQTIIDKIDKNNHETNAKLIAVIALLGTCVLALIIAVAVLIIYVKRLLRNMPKPHSDNFGFDAKKQQQQKQQPQQPQPQQQQQHRDVPMKQVNVQVAAKRTSNPPQQKRDGKVYKKLNV